MGSNVGLILRMIGYPKTALAVNPLSFLMYSVDR